jgi:phosphatidylcholine synthase
MLLTLWIDSSDGTLARLADVRGRIPWFDGRRLDDIVDYFTYVLVPAIFLIQADLVPHPAWVAVPVLASAYGFSRTDAKTEDDFFLGFPSYWNVLAIYLHLLGIEAGAGLWIVLGFAAAVFVPLRYIYPSRTRSLRPITLAVLMAWGLSIVWVAAPAAPDPVWVWATLFGPAYYFGASLLLNLRRAPRG